ncbi:MAG: DUF5723 family protein [Chitinophagales bacterium]
MNKSNLMLIAVVLCTLRAQSQFFIGLRGSYYGGITNVNFNPAIANSPFMVDINLIGAAINVNNNYLGMDRRTLTHPSLFGSADFKTAYLHERVNGRNKYAYAGAQIQGPLSFMFQFGPKNNCSKNAIGFSYHANAVMNADNVPEVIARTSFYGLGASTDALVGYNARSLQARNISVKAAIWNDFGLTYSRVVYDKNNHIIVAGGTVKLLQPIAGAHGFIKNIDYEFTEYNKLNIYNSDAKYAYSDGLLTSQGNPAGGAELTANLKNAIQFKAGKPTVGFDGGVVYQWWPEKNSADQMDCHCEPFSDKKHYKLAAGFSIIDVGALRFKRGTYSRNFTADIRNWDISSVQFPDGLQSFDDTVSSRFTVTPGTEYFTVLLPTRFNLFLDYYIRNDLGIAVTASISPDMSPQKRMVHHVTTFAVIPKYENKWLGFYLPVSFDVMGNVSLGTTLRLGPLTIGTQDLLGLFAKKFVYNADVHASLKVTIPYHKICKRGDFRFQKKRSQSNGFSGFR